MTAEIDHTGLTVEDYPRARAFYLAALAPLGIGIVMEFPMDNGTTAAGLGPSGKAFFWLSGGGRASRMHIAFRADSRAQVDAFYNAAIAAGGADNGAPGIRPHYHEHYYAAYVLDPEGHNIEAVVHGPDQPPKPARSASRSTRSRAKPAKRTAARTAKKTPARSATRKRSAPARKPAGRRSAARKPSGRGRRK